LYLEDFNLSHKRERTPEGQGFELDYDRYSSRLNRKFANADEWWNSYSDLAQEEWGKFSRQQDLLEKVNGDHRLAWIIAHFVGESYEHWLTRDDIDGLGGYSPSECLETTWGVKRLRMLFMQMAC